MQQATNPPSAPASQPNPGDQADPGTPGSGEDVCPAGGGSGRSDAGAACSECGGSGKVVVGIGGG